MTEQSVKRPRLVRVAHLVDSLCLAVKAAPPSRTRSDDARRQIAEIAELLRGRPEEGALALRDALGRLSDTLERTSAAPRRRASAARGRRVLRTLRRIALILSEIGRAHV